MSDLSIVTTWSDTLLQQTLGLNDFWTIFTECAIVGVAVPTAHALLAIAPTFVERKVCAYFQCRLGPMRVGFWGTLQVSADVFKMFIREIFAVDKVDKLLCHIASFLVVIASVGAFSFLPWNKGAHILDFNVGIFLVIVISGTGVLGVLLVGWASNSKYSVSSTMCGAVQMIPYEMTLGLTLTAAVALTGTMQMSGIVEAQTGPWNWLITKGHLPAIIAFLLLLIAGNAETNRRPFDLVEAESELTVGYHTEYSGMGSGFYYLAKYLNLFVIAGLTVAVLLGGWASLNIGVEGLDAVMNYIPGIVRFLDKTFVVVWLLMWIRWTFPRLGIDRILTLERKHLMPLALVNLILMTICMAFGTHGQNVSLLEDLVRWKINNHTLAKSGMESSRS